MAMATVFDDSTDSGGESFNEENGLDLSYCGHSELPPQVFQRTDIFSLNLHQNSLTIVPDAIGNFKHLVSIDLSGNQLVQISNAITQCKKLKTLMARSNHLTNDSLPKDLALLENLEFVSLSGNCFTEFPDQLLACRQVKRVYLGGNRIESVPARICLLESLEILYLGGNRLAEIPAQIGNLGRLSALILSDNKLETLPATLGNLRCLRSLSLHNNRLRVLPPEIVTLDLVELTLRNNPLVNQFVMNMEFAVPSLQELAARVVKLSGQSYGSGELPLHLRDFLGSAHSCLNPKCKGVYFTSCAKSVMFVDFCGKYRLPLMQFLCSPSCTTSSPGVCCSSSDSEADDVTASTNRLKKVLLG